ncbi:hypothetical protein [Actinoalloteichus caeruleus]|uniref:hypothetical protein n=1 Tax=Actinoalloteichus cyanogriseus TaxID=2893586 RepID=UPI0020A59C90|nr:hypothetical protein [Actinoalloteichus caeruleus]
MVGFAGGGEAGESGGERSPVRQQTRRHGEHPGGGVREVVDVGDREVGPPAPSPRDGLGEFGLRHLVGHGRQELVHGTSDLRVHLHRTDVHLELGEMGGQEGEAAGSVVDAGPDAPEATGRREGTVLDRARPAGHVLDHRVRLDAAGPGGGGTGRRGTRDVRPAVRPPAVDECRDDEENTEGDEQAGAELQVTDSGGQQVDGARGEEQGRQLHHFRHPAPPAPGRAVRPVAGAGHTAHAVARHRTRGRFAHGASVGAVCCATGVPP